MNVIHWLKVWFSSRNNALSFYQRGMARVKSRDHAGATDAYSTAIELRASPLEVIAMALFNRELVFVASGEERRCIEDLGELLAMDMAPMNVKTQARAKLARIEDRSAKRKA